GAFPSIHADRRTLEVIPGQPPDLVAPPKGCRFAPRCSFAMPICTEVDPPETRFADGVRVACHLYPTGDLETVGPASAASGAPPASPPAPPPASPPVVAPPAASA
ncbi:MAG: oligopeptide/dipeptide ABC transporter ATP-binding protein, partial [Chloroflexota bacterium]